MVGKWHLVPGHEVTSSGPFGSWPLSKGFERYYGFLIAKTDQYTPDLVYDNHRVQKPGKSNYHLSEDLVDKSLEFLTDHLSVTRASIFPIFSFRGVHEPHQVPKEYIEKYKGVYDKGWDHIREERFKRQKKMGIIPSKTELVERNPGIKSWNELTPKEKKLFYQIPRDVFGISYSHRPANWQTA